MLLLEISQNGKRLNHHLLGIDSVPVSHLFLVTVFAKLESVSISVRANQASRIRTAMKHSVLEFYVKPRFNFKFCRNSILRTVSW